MTTDSEIPSKKFWNNSKKVMQHWEDKIRADERRKITKWYDDNWSDSIHVLEDAAYKKGQADLIGKLTSDEVVLAATIDRFKHSVSYWKYDYEWNSLPPQSRTRRLDEARRYLQAAIKKASESATDKPENAKRKGK